MTTDNIFKIQGTDEVYSSLKDEINPRCKTAKRFVEELWKKVYQYLESDILRELPVQFHPRFWEIYLAAALLESGLNLKPSGGRDGPDICVEADDGSPLWIEAVTASSGQGNDAVQEAKSDTVIDVPDEQIKLRLLNAFDKKSKQYNRYREKNWISSTEVYIIAINAAKVPSARTEREIPRIIRSLLPFGFPVLHLDRHNLGVIDCRYNYQGKVTKASGNKIKTTSFLNSEFSGISAVIYSCADVFNHPDTISQSLLLFHNPLAKNPLPCGFLKSGCEYWVDGQNLKSKK